MWLLQVDMILAAWVWTAEIVKEIRDMLGDKGKVMKIVANIENYAAIKKYVTRRTELGQRWKSN